MTARSIAGVALSALLRNRMRSLLTTLGIVIGVAAVVTMQAMGQGATAYVGTAISGLGSNMLIAVPGATKSFGPMTLGVPLFTMTDVEILRRDAHSVSLVTPTSSRPLRIVVGANNRTTNTGGVAPEYFEIRDWHVSEGRDLNAEDERQAAPVCIVGTTVQSTLFEGRDPVGHELRVHDMTCRVVGLLAQKGAATFGIDQDDVVFMPFTTFARRILGSDRIGTIMAAAVDTDRIDDAREEMTQILRKRRHLRPGDDDDFGVRDPREIQSLLEKVTGMLTLLLAGVAAISLVVGGIGVMNIMLVSVTERTREIGIRRAVGARARDVLVQFLVEAVVLSAVGGLLGVVLGMAGALGTSRAIGVPYVLPWTAPVLALGVSLVVGVVFGVAPARKAARLNPLSALRFE